MGGGLGGKGTNDFFSAKAHCYVNFGRNGLSGSEYLGHYNTKMLINYMGKETMWWVERNGVEGVV